MALRSSLSLLLTTRVDEISLIKGRCVTRYHEATRQPVSQPATGRPLIAATAFPDRRRRSLPTTHAGKLRARTLTAVITLGR
jgi:hypothetical protein